jgi:hypothetical protein
MYNRTSVGSGDWNGFLKLLGAGLAGVALLHAMNTKQWQTWHTAALAVGFVSAISEL